MLLFNVLDVRDHRPVPLPGSLPEDSLELLQNLVQNFAGDFYFLLELPPNHIALIKENT